MRKTRHKKDREERERRYQRQLKEFFDNEEQIMSEAYSRVEGYLNEYYGPWRTTDIMEHIDCTIFEEPPVVSDFIYDVIPDEIMKYIEHPVKNKDVVFTFDDLMKLYSNNTPLNINSSDNELYGDLLYYDSLDTLENEYIISEDISHKIYKTYMYPKIVEKFSNWKKD